MYNDLEFDIDLTSFPCQIVGVWVKITVDLHIVVEFYICQWGPLWCHRLMSILIPELRKKGLYVGNRVHLCIIGIEELPYAVGVSPLHDMESRMRIPCWMKGNAKVTCLGLVDTVEIRLRPLLRCRTIIGPKQMFCFPS